MSLARLASDGPLDGVSRAKVSVHLSRSRQACACVCLRMHMLGGRRPGQPADKGSWALGSGLWAAGEWSLWAMQPIDKGSSPLAPVGSDRNNGELGSGGGHWPFMLPAWGP